MVAVLPWLLADALLSRCERFCNLAATLLLAKHQATVGRQVVILTAERQQLDCQQQRCVDMQAFR